MRLPSLLGFILLIGASQSFATTLSVNISTTAFAPVQFYADSFWLDAYTGNVTLDSTAPVTATINNAHFSVVASPDYPFDQTPFPLNRMLTVDSMIQAVSQQAAMHITYMADDITGYLPLGSTIYNLGADGSVDVTLNAFVMNAFSAGMHDFDVTATFDWTPAGTQPNPSIPEPGTLALMGIAMTGLALRKRGRIHR